MKRNILVKIKMKKPYAKYTLIVQNTKEESFMKIMQTTSH